MATITSLTAHPILDSRGAWTIEVYIVLDDGSQALASVPQGKSTGSREAVSLEASRAVEAVGLLRNELEGRDPGEQHELDALLREIDGTPTCSSLGANAMLGCSVAYGRAVALRRGQPYWEYIASLLGTMPGMPRLYANLLNGGAHAGNNIAFQEHIVIPASTNVFDASHTLQKTYHALGDILRERFGADATLIGDEGGYAPTVETDLQPFELLLEAAERAQVSNYSLGLDAAATGIERSDSELNTLYRAIIEQFPLTYLEDPFDENAVLQTAALQRELGDKVAVTGDDLTVTNSARMEEMQEKNAITGVIIKPNQNGTITGALEAVGAARRYGWRVVVSHRSGETNDTWVADFAYGVAADGFKLGAPARGERVAKYNALMAIAESA